MKKKLLLMLLVMITSIAAKAQSMFEVKYFDILDKETYECIFIYNDDDDCYMRGVSTTPDKDGTYPYWEKNYQAVYDTGDKGEKYLFFIPVKSKDDETIYPSFGMEYTGKDDEIYVYFEDLEEVDEVSEDMIGACEYFEEIEIAEKDEDYFLRFFNEDDEMLTIILDAQGTLSQQDTESNVNTNTVDYGDSPVTMHFIVVAATKDETIGESVETDLNLVKKNFSEIAKQLGIGYKETAIYGNQFNRKNIESAINSVSPEPNDVVVFVYSGHGFRYDDDTDDYPRMLLTYDDLESKQDQMSTTEAYNILRKKGARLTIFLSDCCNSEVGATRAEIEGTSFATRAGNGNTDVNKLRKLFVEESGVVRATAAKAGQFALCDASGGFLLTSVLNNIKAQVSAMGKDEPSWVKILENSSKAVAKKTSNQIDEAGNSQEPQVVVRSVDLKNGEKVSGESDAARLFDGGSGSDNEEDGDWIVGLFCVALPIVIVLLLIVIVVKLFRKKK